MKIPRSSEYADHSLVGADANHRRRLQQALPFLQIDFKYWEHELEKGTLLDPEKRLHVIGSWCILTYYTWLPLNIHYCKKLSSSPLSYVVSIPGLDPNVISGPKGIIMFTSFNTFGRLLCTLAFRSIIF